MSKATIVHLSCNRKLYKRNIELKSMLEFGKRAVTETHVGAKVVTLPKFWCKNVNVGEKVQMRMDDQKRLIIESIE